MAMASCSQARSLSPTHAAIIAKYFIVTLPSIASFPTRKQLDRAPTFAQRFLVPSETSVDQTEHAPLA